MKKPSDAILESLPKGDDYEDDEEAPEGKDSGAKAKAAAGEELASVLGVPEAKRSAFLSALADYMDLC